MHSSQEEQGPESVVWTDSHREGRGGVLGAYPLVIPGDGLIGQGNKACACSPVWCRGWGGDWGV